MLRINLAACNESHCKFGCIYNAKGAGNLRKGHLSRQAEPRVSMPRDRTRLPATSYRIQDGGTMYCARPGVDLKNNTIKENVCKNQ